MSTTTTRTDVLMPSLTDGMVDGTIVAWLVSDGDEVSIGDELFEVETDKATVTVRSEASGPIEILAEVGKAVLVGEPVARIGAPGNEPEAAPAHAVKTIETDPVAPEDQPAAPATNGSGHDAEPLPDGVKASPLAKRVAAVHGVDLSQVTGSGPGRRIVRVDVEQAAGIAPTAKPDAHVPAPTQPATAPGKESGAAAAPTTAKGEVTVEVPTRLQQVVARRMAESKASAPEFVIGVEVDMEQAVTLRTQLKQLAGEEKPPSYNDFIVKAAALALREFPRANGAWKDGQFELFGAVNVGVAVAANDALVVPTIFDADRKSLGEIGRESRRLAGRVREGTVTPGELGGGTFTVSNLGMFGITEFISILNPPQAAILSVGEMRRRAVEHEGELALRNIIRLRLTCDHRILYGADAAGFLGRIKTLLESPLAMSL